MDQYKSSLGVSAAEYANKKTDEFRKSFFSNSQSGSNTHSNPDKARNLSTSDDALSQDDQLKKK